MYWEKKNSCTSLTYGNAPFDNNKLENDSKKVKSFDICEKKMENKLSDLVRWFLTFAME